MSRTEINGRNYAQSKVPNIAVGFDDSASACPAVVQKAGGNPFIIGEMTDLGVFHDGRTAS